MKGSGKRLAYAILKRGYTDRATFAREIGMDPGTLRQQINRDSVSAAHAHVYVRKLKIPLNWLLYGDGPDPFENPAKVEQTSTELPVNDSVTNAVAELNHEDFEGDRDKEGDPVSTYTFIRVVGDLERKIGHLEREIEELRAIMAGTKPAHPRKGGRRAL